MIHGSCAVASNYIDTDSGDVTGGTTIYTYSFAADYYITYRKPTEEEKKAEKAERNRIHFLKYFTRFPAIIDRRRIISLAVRVFDRRITRQHKTRQVKNL